MRKRVEWAARLTRRAAHSTRREVLETLQGNPPGEALRRLTGLVARLPLPDQADLQSHLFEAKERFSLLRRLGVESLYLAQQARRVDVYLLLEIGAITTNRLIALVQAVPTGGLTRQSFFELMVSQVEPYREMAATLCLRTSGLRLLAAAQSRIDRLERLVPLTATEAEVNTVRRCAVECAVYIAFFLEVWWCGHEQARDVQSQP